MHASLVLVSQPANEVIGVDSDLSPPPVASPPPPQSSPPPPGALLLFANLCLAMVRYALRDIANLVLLSCTSP